MIVWRKHNHNECPPWLDGSANVQHRGSMWWVAPPPLGPSGDMTWLATADGWEVAVCGDPDMGALIRELPWGMRLVVQDGRKRDWIIPAILGPDGVPAVARVRRLVDGKWVREDCDDRQSAAVEACESFRNADLEHDAQTFAVLSVLECTYHIDATSLGVLGLIDDVLVYQGLRCASGQLDGR